MKLAQLPPLEFVSRTTYMDGFDEKLGRYDLLEGAAYIARLIMNPLCEGDHAADYFVKIEHMSTAAGKLAVLPLTPDAAEVAGAKSIHFRMDPDGLLINPRRFLPRIEYEKGYLLGYMDDFNRDAAEYLSFTPPREPSLV